MLNAAIIGLGRWGRHLVNSVQGQSKKIRFVAGCTKTRSKAEVYCDNNNIDLRSDYQDIITDPDIDAVVLATPHTQHAKQIIAAAESGKHVFTEKPFTLNSASAKSAVQACKKSGVTIALGHNRRFMENIIAMKAMVDNGELGTLLHIDGNQSSDLSEAANTWRNSSDESPAGGMTSLGIHALDCMIHLGGRIAEIDCYSTRRSTNLNIDDATASVVYFENGMTGTLVSLAATQRIWHIRIFGSKAWVEVNDHRTLSICRDGNIEIKNFVDSPYPHLSSLTDELEAFAEEALGGVPFIISPDQMIHGVAVLEAIIKSSESGQRVKPVF